MLKVLFCLGLDLHVFGTRCISQVVSHVFGKHLIYGDQYYVEEQKCASNTGELTDVILFTQV